MIKYKITGLNLHALPVVFVLAVISVSSMWWGYLLGLHLANSHGINGIIHMLINARISITGLIFLIANIFIPLLRFEPYE